MIYIPYILLIIAFCLVPVALYQERKAEKHRKKLRELEKEFLKNIEK